MKKDEVVNHNQLLRLRKILALLRERERVTQAEMARANECSSKSIQRDIAILQANGWTVEFDKKGYYFGSHMKGDLKASRNGQVAALVLAGCSIDRHLMEHLPSLAMSIRGSLLDLPDLDSLKFRMEDSAICVERCSMTLAQLESFGGLARSIIEGLAVVFRYRAVSHAQEIERIIYPISLKQKDGVWYLVGYDIERSALRIFSASKIKDVSTHIEPYEIPNESIIDQAQRFGSFSIWDSGGEAKVFSIKVKLFDHAADFVRSHSLHQSQEVEVIDEHSVILKLKTSDLTGVNLWLRKFLHLVQIIEPIELKEQYIEDVKEALRLHQY